MRARREMRHHLSALEQKQLITESPTMRSLFLKTITNPAAFKTIRSVRRAQLWGRQAAIVIGLNKLAFRHTAEGKACRTRE